MLPTTAAVLEILIVGVQVLVWLTLLVLPFLPARWRLAPIADSEVLTVAVVGLYAYALGVILDRVADTSYAFLRDDTSFGSKVLKEWLGNPPKSEKVPRFAVMRLRVMAFDDGRARFLEYQRSRLRIARATALNILFLAFALPWFLLARTDLGAPSVVAIELVLISLFALSVKATEDVGDAYAGRLMDAYRMWSNEYPELAKREKKMFGNEVPRECRRYAAVTYKESDDNFRFLVVTTSGKGKHWTFPKGRKQRKKERGWEAARREAREEAGVMGEVERKRLCRYSFPASDDKCDQIQVDAYLLLVHEEGLPRKGKDANRKIRWETPTRTEELLGKGRSDHYANEQAHVIEAALKRIASSPPSHEALIATPPRSPSA